jgi:hypothetical protein
MMEIGDIVRLKPETWRTDRTALVVGRFNALMVYVLWGHTGATERVNQQYFEVVSESR